MSKVIFVKQCGDSTVELQFKPQLETDVDENSNLLDFDL